MIYVVTNRHLIGTHPMENIVENSIISGASRIILREKDLCNESLYEMAVRIKKITDAHDIPLIINGNMEVALKVGAYGFHTGYNGLIKSSHNIPMKLGVSIHSIEEAILAEQKGADYILAGNIFETSCKPGLRGRGLDFIKNICSKVSIPVIGIGGINIDNASDIINAGASGVAIMSLAMQDIKGEKLKKVKEQIS